MKQLTNYISTLKEQSFEGWSEGEKNGYLTALTSVQEFINREAITVSVEGEKPITLAEFIAINNAEEDNLLTDDDIESVSKLAIGERIYVGLSEVKRIS